MLDQGELAREAEAFVRKRRKIASLMVAERKIPGWRRRFALLPVLTFSWKPLQISASWFEPVPVDRMAAIVGHLASHPEDRSKICNVDPGEWIDAPPAAGGRATSVR